MRSRNRGSGMAKRAACAGLGLLCGLAPRAGHADRPAEAKKNYEVAMRHLEAGGEMLMYGNVDGMLENFVGKIVKTIAALPGNDQDMVEARALANRIHAFLNRQGFYALQSFGTSAVPLGDGMHRVRSFLGRDAQAANLPLWRAMIGGQPRALAALPLIPADAALVQISTGELAQLWKLVRAGVNEIAPPDGRKEFESALAEMAEELGVGADQLAASLGDEFFLALRLSATETVTFPMADQPFSMPTPSLLIGVRLANNTLPELIAKQAAAAGMAVERSQAGGATLLTVNVPFELPFTVRPTMAAAHGFLLLGSDPDTVRAALAAQEKKNGLARSASFAAAFKGLSWQACNGLSYMDARLGKAFDNYNEVSMASMKSFQGGGMGMVATIPMAIMSSMTKSMSRGTRPDSGASVTLNLPHGIVTEARSTSGGSDLLATMTVLPAVAVIGMGAGVVLPSAARVSVRSQEISMVAELSQIGKACIMYSMDNDEAFPRTLSQLNSVHLPPQILAGDRFILVGGLKASDAPQAVLAFSKPQPGQTEGIAVLRVDGSVQRLSSEEWAKISTTPSLFFGVTDKAKLKELQGRVQLPLEYAGLLRKN